MYFRINLQWQDKRFISVNDHRTSECGSGHVLWTKPNQFWLPKLYINGALELVSYQSFSYPDINRQLHKKTIL